MPPNQPNQHLRGTRHSQYIKYDIMYNTCLTLLGPFTGIHIHTSTSPPDSVDSPAVGSSMVRHGVGGRREVVKGVALAFGRPMPEVITLRALDAARMSIRPCKHRSSIEASVPIKRSAARPVRPRGRERSGRKACVRAKHSILPYMGYAIAYLQGGPCADGTCVAEISL